MSRGVGLACKHITTLLSTSTALMILDASKIEAVKILRVVRLFRVFRFFRQLSTLALMVADSVKQLLWALVMFLLIMCLGSRLQLSSQTNDLLHLHVQRTYVLRLSSSRLGLSHDAVCLARYVFAITLTSSCTDWLKEEVDYNLPDWEQRIMAGTHGEGGLSHCRTPPLPRSLFVRVCVCRCFGSLCLYSSGQRYTESEISLARASCWGGQASADTVSLAPAYWWQWLLVRPIFVGRSESHAPAGIKHVHHFFGNVPRSVYTLFQTTLGGISWHEVTDALAQVDVPLGSSRAYISRTTRVALHRSISLDITQGTMPKQMSGRSCKIIMYAVHYLHAHVGIHECKFASFFIYLSIYLSIYRSIYRSISLSLSVAFSLSLSLSLSLPLSLSLSRSLSRFLTLSLSLSLSVSLALSVFPSSIHPSIFASLHACPMLAGV